MSDNLFISGIGTDVGKTVVSAILTEALGADYWKPIQAGDLQNSDTIKVQRLVSNEKTTFHVERYKLQEPMSPHAAAEREGIEIKLVDFQLPETNNRLIVEGAGGLLVPFNQKDTVLDLATELNVSIVLVISNYLGSINHSLLSLEVLKNRKVPVKGIIISGESNPESEKVILDNTDYKLLGRVPFLPVLNKESIQKEAENFKQI